MGLRITGRGGPALVYVCSKACRLLQRIASHKRTMERGQGAPGGRWESGCIPRPDDNENANNQKINTPLPPVYAVRLCNCEPGCASSVVSAAIRIQVAWKRHGPGSPSAALQRQRCYDPEPPGLATRLMMRWMKTTRTWILRATSGRNSVMRLSVGARARPMP